MMEPVLKMEHVTKRFSGLIAVNDLSLEMPENCIHSLIGPNGSGKTTTVNMITGVLPVSEGEIFYRGVKTSGSPVYRIARLGVGRTFQNLKLFGSMSVLENLMIGAHQMTKIGLVRFLVDLPGEKREAAGLNPSERREFVDILLKTHERGIDLFLIEHNMDVVMNISTKITVLNFGAKIAEGTPYEIQNNDEVIRAYLGDKYKPVEG